MLHPEFPRARARGFTLIELMVAMVVSGIVVLGIFAFSTIQRSTNTIHERNLRVQQALEGAMWSVGQDLRMAGMPFARMCSELRVWDPSNGGRLLNPGGPGTPANAVRDALTGEHYWVLRDGIQAHWDSSAATSIQGDDGTSATPGSAADSLDVLVADPIYTESLGLFQLAADLDGVSTDVAFRTGIALDNGNTDHLAEVRQMFPPGSFFIIVRDPTPMGETIPVRAERHGQCILLQSTGDIFEGGQPQEWRVPVGGESGFNQGLATLLSDPGGTETCLLHADCDDWTPGPAAGTYSATFQTSWIVPLGRLRWSRYEIDYSIPTLPYLVRSDIIGYQDGDPSDWGAVDYPDCAAGTCVGPQLHLPGSNAPPRAVAIGPMIEDMQVAVGCDGYTVGATGHQWPTRSLEEPELGFDEALPGNQQIDEDRASRGTDEWLGNARQETWAPDCVYYGTGEYDAEEWLVVEGGGNTPRYRMSPQTLRVTLLGSSEYTEEAGGTATATLQAIEDREPLASSVGTRQRFFLTERFTPENLRWRDPSVL